MDILQNALLNDRLDRSGINGRESYTLVAFFDEVPNNVALGCGIARLDRRVEDDRRPQFAGRWQAADLSRRPEGRQVIGNNRQWNMSRVAFALDRVAKRAGSLVKLRGRLGKHIVSRRFSLSQDSLFGGQSGSLNRT